MRRKKREKLDHKTFWATFVYFNLKTDVLKIPTHVDQVRFRYYGANDSDLHRMVQEVKSINQLDLDETDVTDEGMKYLLELSYLRELRLKGCQKITNQAMEFICKFEGLELLHLHDTEINTDGFQHIGNLKQLKRLLIQADFQDPKLEEIYASLPKDCNLTVNYKPYPPDSETTSFILP